MIEKIEINNGKIYEVEKSFPQKLWKKAKEYITFENPFTQYYVYKQEEQILGFINYDILYERAELIYIVVLEEYQNKGIGQKLIKYMIKDCQKRQVENITLEVNTKNKKAIALYKKNGFREVALRKAYYQGIDGILMEKELIE